jgi:hypothetical protein
VTDEGIENNDAFNISNPSNSNQKSKSVENYPNSIYGIVKSRGSEVVTAAQY